MMKVESVREIQKANSDLLAKIEQDFNSRFDKVEAGLRAIHTEQRELK
jgi:hypothetical protein